MAVSLPLEPVYYYECYRGDYRLTYFVPYHMMKEMVDAGSVDKSVLADYPLGVDLDCNASDFNTFEKKYGYRPKYSAKAMENAFLAMYSSTKNWKKFRGTGFIPARDMEEYIPVIDEDLKKEKLTVEQMEPIPEAASMQKRKAWAAQKLRVLQKAQQKLQKMDISGMDKKKLMNQQEFSKIKMEKGKESTKEFYSRLYQKE